MLHHDINKPLMPTETKHQGENIQSSPAKENIGINIKGVFITNAKKSVWGNSELTYAEVLRGLKKGANIQLHRNDKEETYTTANISSFGSDVLAVGDKEEKNNECVSVKTRDLPQLYEQSSIPKADDCTVSDKKAAKTKQKFGGNTPAITTKKNMTTSTASMPSQNQATLPKIQIPTKTAVEHEAESRPMNSGTSTKQVTSTSLSFADVLKGIESKKIITSSTQNSESIKESLQNEYIDDPIIKSGDYQISNESHAEEKRQTIASSSKRKRKSKEYGKPNKSSVNRKTIGDKNSEKDYGSQASSSTVMEVSEFSDLTIVNVTGVDQNNTFEGRRDKQSESFAEKKYLGSKNCEEKEIVEDQTDLVGKSSSSSKVYVDNGKNVSNVDKTHTGMDVNMPSQDRCDSNQSVTAVPAKKNRKRKAKKIFADMETGAIIDTTSKNNNHVESSCQDDQQSLSNESSALETSTSSCTDNCKEAGQVLSQLTLNKKKKTKVEKIRKSNSAKISALLERHKVEFENELGTHEQQEDKHPTPVVLDDSRIASGNSAEDFKSCLIFEDYEFMQKSNTLINESNMPKRSEGSLETSSENVAGSIQVSDVQPCFDNVCISQSSEVELVVCEDEEENALVKMREESFMETLDHSEQLDQVNVLRLPENLENVEENISSQEANRSSEPISSDTTQENTDLINKTLETSTEDVAGSIQVSDVQHCIDNVHTSQPSEVELVIYEDEEDNALVKMREESFKETLDHEKHAQQLDQVNILRLPENLENVEESISSQEANRNSESISCAATQEDTDFINKTLETLTENVGEGTDFINKVLETSTENVAGSIQVSDVQPSINDVHTSQPSEVELVICEDDENIIKTINKRADDAENGGSPCDTDTVNVDRVQKTDTEENNVAPVNAPNNELASSATKISTNSNDNNDAIKFPSQCSNWKDRRQKISMITHEEYHLNPISYIRMELPIVTAEIITTHDTDSQCFIHPNSGKVLLDNADSQTEEVISIEPSILEEQHIATEVSVLDPNIETSMQSKSSSVLVKQSSTTEHKNYSEALLTSDSMNISKEFATTTSNCVYKTTTIIYGASSHQHVIEEHYTHPLIVEQIVRDVDTHPEQSLTALNDVESDLTTSLGPMCGRNIESQNEINISTDEIVNDEENVLIRARNESLLCDDVLDRFIFPKEYTKTIYLETPDEEASENSEKDKMSDEENLLIKMKFESEENDKDIVLAKDTSGHEISQYDTVSKDFSLPHQLQVITSSDHSEPEKGLTFVTPEVSVSAEKIENIPEYESNTSSQADAGLGHTSVANIQVSVDHQTNPLIFEHPISDLQIQSTNISNNAELQLHTKSETIPSALKDVKSSITTTTIFLTSVDDSATRGASEPQDDTDALLSEPIDDEEVALIKMREKSFLEDDISTVRALNEKVENIILPVKEMSANVISEFSEKSTSQLQSILCQETPNNENDTVKQIEAINGNDQFLSRKEPEKSETDVVEILDTNDDDACQQSAPSAIEDEKESMLHQEENIFCQQAETNSETHSCESVNETTDFPGMALEAETTNVSGSIDVSDVQSCDDIVHTSQTLIMQVVHGTENDEKTREEEDQEDNVLLIMREQSYIEPSNHQEQAEKWNPVIVLQEQQNEHDERREKPEEESKTSLDNVSDRFEVDHLRRDEIFNDEENISDKMQETHVEVKPTNQTSLSFDKQQPQLRDDEENDEKTIEGVDEEENALVKMRDESFMEALDLLKHGEHGDQGSIHHLPEYLENVEENISSQEANRSSEPISSDATQEGTDFINKTLETSTENMAGGIQVSDVQHCIDNVHTSQSSEVELVICEDEEENVLVKMREESLMEALEHAEQLDQVNIPRLPENLENVEENISSQEANRNSESFSYDATQEDTDNINKTLETSSENVTGSIQVSDVPPCIDNVCISQSSEVELVICEDEEENALVKMREESFMDALIHPKHAEQSDQVNILHLPENLENVEENIFSQEANRMSESISCDATQEGTDFINKTLETSTGNVAGSIQVSDVQDCTDIVHTSQPTEAELVISEGDEKIIKTIKQREDDEDNSSIIIRDEFIMATADYPELAEKLNQAIVPQEDLSTEKQQTSDTSEKLECNKASLDNESDRIDAELKTTTHDTQEQNVCGEVTNEEKTSGREDEEENALIKMRDQSFMEPSDHLEHAANLNSVNINLEENISSQEANRNSESISCEATQKDPDFINKTLDTLTENEAGNIQVSDVQPCIDSVHTSQSSEFEFVICTDDENIKTLKEREDDEENASIIMREKSTMEISDYPKLAENMHPVTILQEDLSKDTPSDRSEILERHKTSLDNVSDYIDTEYVLIDKHTNNEEIVLITMQEAIVESTNQTTQSLDKQQQKVCDNVENDEKTGETGEGEDEEENALIKMRENSLMEASGYSEHAEKLDPLSVLRIPQNIENVEENVPSQEADRKDETMSYEATLKMSMDNETENIQVSDVQLCIDNAASQSFEVRDYEENLNKIREGDDDEGNVSITMRDESVMEKSDHLEHAEEFDPVIFQQPDLSEEKQPKDVSVKLERNKPSLDASGIIDADNVPRDEIVNNEEIGLIKMQETHVESTNQTSQSLDKQQEFCDDADNNKKIKEGEDEEEKALSQMREESFIEALDHLKHADKLEPVNALHFLENLENVEENISAPEANRESESISCDATPEDADFINKTMETSTENEAGSVQVSDVQPCTDNVHTSLPLEVELVICEDDENIKTPKDREDDEENASVIMRDESFMDASDYPEHAEQLGHVIVPQDDLIEDKQLSDTSEKSEWNKASLDNVSDSTGADYDVPIVKHVNDEEIVLIKMPETGVELESANYASRSLDKQQQICGDVENDEKTKVNEDEEENALIKMRDESFNVVSDHFEHAENVDPVKGIHLPENIVNPSKEAERMGESVPCEAVLQTSTENKAGNIQSSDIVVVCNDDENLKKIGEGNDDEEKSSVMIGDEPIMETLALPEDADILDLVIVPKDLCKEKQPSDTSDEFEITKASLDNASDSAGSQHVPTDEMKPNHAENMNENIVLQETERDSEPIACDAGKENTDFTCTALEDFGTNEESKIYVSDAQPCDEDYDVKIRERVDEEEEEALIKMREESFMKTSDHPEHAEKVESVIVQQEKMNEDKQHRDASEDSEQSKVLLDNAIYCTDADHASKDTLINDENLILRKTQEEVQVTNHSESKENLQEKTCLQETENETMLSDAVKDSTDTNTALEILVTNEAGESQVSDVQPSIENVNISQTLDIQLMISDNAENEEKATGGENQEENALIKIRRQHSMEEKLDSLESADHIVQDATLDSNTTVAQFQPQLSEEPQPALTKTTVQIDSENVNDPMNLQHIPRVDFTDKEKIILIDMKDNSSVQDEMSNYSENIENLEKPILSQEDCTLNSIVTISNVVKNDEIISQCISREDKAIVNNNKPDSFDVYDIKTTTPDTSGKDKRNFSYENEKNQFHSYWKYRDAELLDALNKVSIETDQPIDSIEEELYTFNKNYNNTEERMKSYMYEMRNVSKYFDYCDAEVKHNLLRVSDDTENIHQHTSDSNSDITPKANNSILETEQSVTNTSIDEKNLIIQNKNIVQEIPQDASDLSKDTQYQIQNRIETFVYELNDVIDHWKYADAESMYVAYKSPIVTSLNDADHDEILKQGEPNKQELSNSILSTSVAASIENEKGEHILFDELNNKLNRPSDYDEDAPIKVPESPLNNRATSFIYEAKVYHDYWKYADAETFNMTYRTQPVTSTECVKFKEFTKDMPKHESSILNKSDMSDEVIQNENKAEKPSKIEPLYSEVVSGNNKHKTVALAVEATNFEPDGKCSTITDSALSDDEETSDVPAKNQNTNIPSEVQHVDITMENIGPILPKEGLDDPNIIASGDLKPQTSNTETLPQCRVEGVKEVPLPTESEEKYNDGKDTDFFKSTINDEHDISKEAASIEFVDIDTKATNSSESTNEVNNDICIEISQQYQEEKSHDTSENFKITAAQNTTKSAENEYTNDKPKESIISCIESSALSIGMDADGSDKPQLLLTAHQLDAFWEDKPLYDDAESTYIKSIENLNKCIVPEQDYPRAVDSIVDEQVPTQLTQASNNILTKPLLQNPATNSNLSVPPPNPPITLLGTTSTVNIRNPKETVDDCTIYEQTLSESVENILRSLLNEELKMNNLPYDNMNCLIKGLQVLIEKLSEYKEQNYAISTSLPQNADYKIKESVRLIDERIDFLRQRAQDGLEKIQQSLKLREQRKSKLDTYFKILEEIEHWMTTTSILLMDFDTSPEKSSLEEILQHNQRLLTDLREKENQSKSIYEMTENYLQYNDTRDKAEPLRTSFSNIIRIIREKALILEDNIQRINHLIEPTAVGKVDNEMQTSPLVSMDCTDNIPAKHQEASSQANLERSTDNLIIIQSISEGEETVQISNVRNISSNESDNDIIVEAKYTPLKFGESNKLSEITLQNIPTSTFETTFVEPDDSTTEIRVNKDGSRKITLKKVFQPIESIESSDAVKTLVTTTIQPESSVLIMSDNKTTDEQTFDNSEPLKVVGSILEDIQCKVMDVMEQSEGVSSEEKQDSQVLESVAQKVDLIASIVDSPNSNIESTQRIYDIDTKLTEPKYSPTTELPKELITGIDDVWPQLEEPPASVSVTTIKTLSTVTVKAPLSDSDIIPDIWPSNMNTGSEYNTPVLPSIKTLEETKSQHMSDDEQSNTFILPENLQSSETDTNKIEDSSCLPLHLGDTANEEGISGDAISTPKTPHVELSIEKSPIEPNLGQQSLDLPANQVDLHKSEISYDEANEPERSSLNQDVEQAITNLQECSIGHPDEKKTHDNSEITKDERENQLQVHVSSLKDDQSAITLSMNMPYVPDKSIKVSLVELDATSKNILPVTEEPIAVEKIPGLSDIDIDKGYEADKTAMEGESENDDASKKRKRKKKKVKQDADKDQKSDVPLEIPKDDAEKSDLKQDIDQIRIDPTEVIEGYPDELTAPLQCQIVLPTEVIEATYVEDVHQQTSPVRKDSFEDEADREIALITSDNLLVPLDFEQKSIQTSPENETVKLSKQTSPIISQSVYVDCKEVQTEIHALESESQTVPIESKEQKEQDVQTEPTVAETIEVDEAKPEACNVANQTTIVTTTETEMQTTEDFNQLVEPILAKIIDSTVELGIGTSRQSVQTSPVRFIESSIASAPPSDAQNEFVQTINIDVVDVQTSTESTYADKGSSPAVPYAVSEIEIQTSPVHALTADVETLQKESAEPTIDDHREETTSIRLEKTDAQAQTQSTETSIQGTQTAVVDQPTTSEPQKKKTKSKKGKKSNLIPIELEVKTELSVPEWENNVEPITITKTYVDSNKMDSTNALNVQIQVEFDHPKQSTTYKPLTDEIFVDNLWKISLVDYFSILRAQTSFAEEKTVPWSEMATMLSKIWSESNSGTIRHPDFFYKPFTSEAYEDSSTDVEKLQTLLNQTENNLELQNLILFEELEKMNIQAEEILVGLSNTTQWNEAERSRQQRIDGAKLQCIMDKLNCLSKYTTENNIDSDQNITASIEHTRRGVEQLIKCLAAAEDTNQRIAEIVHDVSTILQQTNNRLHDIDEKINSAVLDHSLAINEKLYVLEENEMYNNECLDKLTSILENISNSRSAMADTNIEEDFKNVDHMARKIQQTITIERNKLLQLTGLAEEYEQTLLEFEEIASAAADFIDNEISTNSLKELEEEMQRYRKFFVNLSHCKMILESLELNLDPITRTKHADLHSALYNKTSIILERAVDRAARLAQAASKWTVLEKEMRDETQWLQVAQQRVPDLQNVSSEDFEQYIKLYESLHQDILWHHSKMVQHNQIAKVMQECVCAPTLEKESSESLTVVTALKEEVSLYLIKLQKFKNHWNRYNAAADKLHEWVCYAQKHLSSITLPQNLAETSVEDMRKFWEVKAQYEVMNKKVYDISCNSLDNALTTISIADEELQRQLHNQLIDSWTTVATRIIDMQNHVYNSIKTSSTTSTDKITFIENELRDINSTFKDLKGVLKSSEDLCLYLEKIHTLKTRVHLIDSELGQIALATDFNVEKITELFEISTNVSNQINEEHEAAENFYKRLEIIENGIKAQEKHFIDITKVLDECCSRINRKKPDVEKSLDDCKICQSELSDSWSELMKLRQMLHTLPMNLKVTISPQQTERDLSILQNIHSDLERKCESNMSQLRDRLVLWNKFHRQLETIHNHIQETEFMMDLIQLHETADYHRLLKATERLDALLVEIEHKKHTIDDLQTITKPLLETSEPSVSIEIQETVEQITVLWQNTQENLHDLCQRYEKAVKLWDHYNNICEGVKDCISQNCTTSCEHREVDDLQMLRQCQETVTERKRDLNKLKQFIEDINKQVGFNIGDTMLSEIDEFARRMEDISEDLTFQINTTTCKHAEKAVAQTTYASSNAMVKQIQQDLKLPLPDSQHGDIIMDLETNLLNLSATEACLKNVAPQKPNTSDDDSIYTDFKNLHSLSFALLQDTLHQHQHLLQQMVLQNDVHYMLKYWEIFLLHTAAFLDHKIPSDYSGLQQFRDQYSVLDYLIRQWKTSILKISQFRSGSEDLYESLNQQHYNCIQKLNENREKIEECLRHWRNFKSLRTTLQEATANIEAEKHNLQMEYINIKELPKLITKVDSLQARFSELEGDLIKMNQVVAQLTSSLPEEEINAEIKSEQSSTTLRISKLAENVNTWRIFLMGVSELQSDFKTQCNHIKDNLLELEQCLCNLQRDNPVTSQHHLNMLKNEKLRLVCVKEDLMRINGVKEKLQYCISPFDAKHIHKKVTSLWQLFEKQENTISMLLKQMEDRTHNRKLFLNHYNLLMEWICQFEKRLNDSNKYEMCEEDANFIKSIEDMLLQEVSSKESEVVWFNAIGNDLMKALPPGDIQMEISSKLEILNEAWSKLIRHCQDRRQKISEVSSTAILLEQRINEIKIWMAETEWELKQPLIFENVEKGCLDKLLDDYEKLQRSIEGNSGNIAEILNLCEMLFTDVESWNVHIDRKFISQTVKSLEISWKHICIDTSKRKQDLLTIWSMLVELQRISDSHQSWIDQTTEFLDDIQNQTNNATDNEKLCGILQKLSTKHADILTQESILQILRKLYISLNKHDRVERSNMHNITMAAKHLLVTWEKMLWKFNSVKTRIEELSNLYASFNSEYENIIVSLTQIDVKVTNIKHLQEETDAQTPETKLKCLRDLHNELKYVINLFDAQDELGSSLIELLPDKSVMSEEVQNRIMEYHQLANNIKLTLDSLLDQTNYGHTEKAERDYAVQVDTLSPLSLTAKDAYLYQLRTAIAEAKSNLALLKSSISEINASNFMTSTQTISKASAACESSIELIKHLNALLTSECNCSEEEAMSSSIKQESDKYTLYLSEWHTKQQKLEELRPFPAAYNIICLHNDDYLTCPLCTNRNWQQIDNDLWRLEQWLSMAEASQRSQHTQPSNDIDTLEDAIQDHREFLLDLDSHKSIIKSLNIVGEHLATHTLDTEKAVKLRERLQNNNMRWDKVCNQASHWQALLHRTLMENKEFHRTVTELSIWLEQTENKIKTSEPIDLTMDKAVIERKFKIFMELRNDLVRCEPRIVSLQETTSQLTKYLDGSTSQKFNEIYAKLTDLRLRFHSIRRLVEVYTVKIAAAIGTDRPLDTIAIGADSTQGNQESSGSFSQVAAHDANARNADDGDHINTTVLTRSYRFLGRVLRASLPIQAMLLLLLGVATLMPHGEDYSCSFTNNFARSLEPMLRYPNGPPPI